MSKRTFKPQASSSRAASGAFGGAFSTPSAFGAASSPLSFVSEPPDLSSISDPNTIVAFKNLSKKDSTTKAKALEDLQTHILTPKAQLEEPVLEAWIKIYPRTSIDSARRVRQLSHMVHGQISSTTGKRIAKYMPKIAGAWLAGLYDNDRSVSRSAQESLESVFSSPEKRRNLRRAYQQSIVEYCRDVIDNETVLTLSDERTTSPDDAEMKYSRVIAAAISVVASLLTDLTPEDIMRQQTLYDELLCDAKLWGLAFYRDATVRRSVCKLLRVCLSHQSETIASSLREISNAFLSKALNSDQTGSTSEYSETLLALTKAYPSVWTFNYSGKRIASQRLKQFLKRGSQNGPPEFWINVSKLFQILPVDILPKTSIEAIELLDSIHLGILTKDEPRMNTVIAFETYLDVGGLVITHLQLSEQDAVVQKMVLPLILQYLKPLPENYEWSVPLQQGLDIAGRALRLLGMTKRFETEWRQISNGLVQDMKSSHPQQSKDFRTSQLAIEGYGTRWVQLQSRAMKYNVPDTVRTIFLEASICTLHEALQLLESRNGKPFCAAGIIESLLHHIGDDILNDKIMAARLLTFAKESFPRIFISPSCSRLTSILYLLEGQPNFSQAWQVTIQAVLDSPDVLAKSEALKELLTSPRIPKGFSLAASNSDLQAFILQQTEDALQGASDWVLVVQVFKNSESISMETTHQILSEMARSLSVTERVSCSLRGLQAIAQQSPSVIQEFLSTSAGTELLRNVLYLAESADDPISQEASGFNSVIQELLLSPSSGEIARASVFDVINTSLVRASSSSLSVDSIIDLAQKLLNSAGMNQAHTANRLLPSKLHWSTALSLFIDRKPSYSLQITNPLGGAIYLVDGDYDTPPATLVQRDSEGYSVPLRMAMFTTRLLKNTDLVLKIPSSRRREVFEHLILSVHLADDNLGFAGSNNFWSIYTPEVESEIVDFVSDSQGLITRWLQKSDSWWVEDDPSSEYLFVREAVKSFRERSGDHTALAYHNSRAYCLAVSELIEVHGWQSKKMQEAESILTTLRRSQNVFFATGFLVAHKVPFSNSRSASRLCNELVAELTGLKAREESEKVLRYLVMLNAIVQNQENAREAIAKQRLIFFVQRVATWLLDEAVGLPVKAEVSRALTPLLPYMKDIYGAHWADLFAHITALWASCPPLGIQRGFSEMYIPAIHATLKLYALLKRLKGEDDANEDLVDTWKEFEESSTAGLIHLLKQSQHFPDDFHQPLKIVNELLSRQISKLSIHHMGESHELFPLLYVESQPVQRTAFEILHKQIPAAQEQISVDIALEKKSARLPEELLSLILESPTLAAFAGASFERSMPLPLRGYLLSWLLVFDHFRNSSHKAKEDYVEHLKEGDYVTGLLDFTFDFLGHDRGKPVDVSKLDVKTYSLDSVESPMTDTQWLLTHVYYLSLKHISSLAKSWWIDCKARQKVISVESWTEKHISPHIIAGALNSVSEWAASQESEPDKTLRVKVSQRAREVSVGYEVDGQTMQMVIRLPEAFPLRPAAVEGVQRVAVNDQKWQSWIRTTQGSITFSNNNLVDGLVAWRRNVIGTLEGQTECAICYSIISTDKQLPSKKCSTCKNLFHSSCLYRWFKTSNGSTCPLCRTSFNYD